MKASGVLAGIALALVSSVPATVTAQVYVMTTVRMAEDGDKERPPRPIPGSIRDGPSEIVLLLR